VVFSIHLCIIKNLIRLCLIKSVLFSKNLIRVMVMLH